ncbi:MAG: sigma-70 family RNA polymerase sigma factor [Acidobacteriota bacterium]|nr:sigma-70 family RNA polymerase sigma factor [Acidobacteriota bacterium]
MSADLAKRLMSGDSGALGELYDIHAASVYALALRITGKPADAEDVTQDVFTQAWRSAGRFDAARGNLAAWLLIMTRTRALDRLRHDRRRPADSVAPSTFDAIPNDAPGVDQVAATNEEAALARRAVDALPPDQREALELAYFEGLTHSEIAARTSQPLGTVKTRIRTAMQRVRASMGIQPLTGGSA